MFEEKTVFVLGAGASAPFTFPTSVKGVRYFFSLQVVVAA